MFGEKKLVQIEVFDHALPYSVLLEELQAQGKARPGDEVVTQHVIEEYKALGDAKDALDNWSAKRPHTRAKKQEQGKEEQNAQINNVRKAEWECETADQKFTDILHRADREALCFSGGGIRSATICLGLLQGLARFSMRDSNGRPGMLHKTNFLSTVSGGGYIGSWFMAWAVRHPLGYPGVVSEIAKSGMTGVDPEPRPLRHLREYTSFLAPRLGGLTVDTWTLAATVLRNLFLNNCMLLPVLAAVLCLPVLVGSVMCHLASAGSAWPENKWTWAFAVSLSIALVLLCFVQTFSKEWHWYGRDQDQPWISRMRAQRLLFISNLIITFVVAGMVVYWLASPQLDVNWWRSLANVFAISTTFHFAFLIGIPLVVPALYGCIFALRAGHTAWKVCKDCFCFLLAVPVVALATSALLLLLAHYADPLQAALLQVPHFATNWKGKNLWPDSASAYVFGVPLVWAILLTASSLFTGIVASGDSEENREWWARMKAIHMLLMVGWLAASFIAFYGPFVVNGIVASLTVIVGAVAAFIAKSPRTPAQITQGSTWTLDLVASVLGLLFLFLLAVTLAYVNRWAIGNFENGTRWLVYASLLLLFAGFCNLFFSVNTFSLHGMYRSRLIRAYLGASNELRTPDFFTNFDAADNMPEADLPGGGDLPLHIINATLNLVATTNTAWTQRKAESFTFSPLHCGSFRAGYVPTHSYAGVDGVTLGTAVAISGAAVNPNMGYHSSPLLTLIMTLFNVRLGCWLPNPKLDKDEDFFRHSSPRFALLPLLNEALGITNDKGNFVELSDGAHFENLALYEMVMRRCHRIVVVDGGADSAFEFEDLGNAVRKIRIDLGIQIEFTHHNYVPIGNNPQAIYCAIARICYKEVDGHDDPEGRQVKDGELIYFKPLVRGSEAIDVRNYSTTHKDFPHESTMDQFFNEPQFESYRKMGITMVEAVIAHAPAHAFTTREFFAAARQYCATATSLPPATRRVLDEATAFFKSGKMQVTLGSR